MTSVIVTVRALDDTDAESDEVEFDVGIVAGGDR